MRAWRCKIGAWTANEIAPGQDELMRDAIASAFTAVTGVKPDFIFSGWNASLTEQESAVLENRLPATCQHGHLTRSCELCEKDAEIARLTAANEALRERVRAWIDEYLRQSEGCCGDDLPFPNFEALEAATEEKTDGT